MEGASYLGLLVVAQLDPLGLVQKWKPGSHIQTRNHGKWHPPQDRSWGSHDPGGPTFCNCALQAAALHPSYSKSLSAPLSLSLSSLAFLTLSPSLSLSSSSSLFRPHQTTTQPIRSSQRPSPPVFVCAHTHFAHLPFCICCPSVVPIQQPQPATAKPSASLIVSFATASLF